MVAFSIPPWFAIQTKPRPNTMKAWSVALTVLCSCWKFIQLRQGTDVLICVELLGRGASCYFLLVKYGQVKRNENWNIDLICWNVIFLHDRKSRHPTSFQILDYFHCSKNDSAHQDGEVDPQFFEDVGIKKLGDSKKCRASLNRRAIGKYQTILKIWVFPKIGVPQNGWFIRENPIKMGDLGVPLFLETPILLKCENNQRDQPLKFW